MKFKFGDDLYDIKEEFLNGLNDYLAELDYIKDTDFSNTDNNTEDYLRFLYVSFGEILIKSEIINNFSLELIENLENHYNQADIIKEHYLTYRKYNFVLYIVNEKIIAVVDFISEELLQWMEENLEIEEIEVKIVEKKEILITIHKTFEIDMMRYLIYSNEKNKYSPSASKIHSSSKSYLVFVYLSIGIFILLSLKSVFFAVFSIVIFNISYFVSTFYKLFLSLLAKDNKIDELIESEKEEILPIYTILLPLFNEKKETILQLIKSTDSINYTKHKLDIKILVEAEDRDTIEIIESLNLPYNFDLIIVPDGEKYDHPQTKARACNYGFNFAKGDYVVIYDGDDITDPNQILFSLQKFKFDKEISCIQYPLNSYNAKTNLLTHFYSIEFDLWYRVFLPSTQKLEMPVTLGGTSNHFRVEALQNNLWDMYNLTEDADLGIRMWLNQNDKIYIANNFITLEEAPLSLKALIKQRSRWIKGFIQTYLVHRKCRFAEENDDRKFRFSLFMNFFIALPILSSLSFLPNIFEFMILKFFHNKQNIMETLGYSAIIIFIFSSIVQIIPIMIHKRKLTYEIGLSVILFPLYSIVVNVVGGYKALIQFFTKPFYWEKTEHGLDNSGDKLLEKK